MNGHEMEEARVEAAAWRIAAMTLTYTHPETTQECGLDAIRRGALPKSLEDIDLGAKEALQGVFRVARAIVQAARTLGPSLLKVGSAQDVEQLIIRSAVQHLESVAAPANGPVLEAGIARAFAARPSLLDGLLGAVAGSPVWEARVESSVVKVVERDRCGGEIVSSGIALCPRGHILTAAHVVGALDAFEIGFRYWDRALGEEKELRGGARVLWRDRRRDVAVLKADETTWSAFLNQGLNPARPDVRPPEDLRSHRVLCVGYKDPELFASPTWATGTVAPYYPMRTVKFRDGREQLCLVLLLHGHDENQPEVRITEGMSGGLVVDLERPERFGVGMVTGATRRVYQHWHDVWEETDSAVYGFAVPLAEIPESWPYLRACCLAPTRCAPSWHGAQGVARPATQSEDD